MGRVVPVSVVLPVHNAARYIGAAVDSILSQTFRDFELILLDDGSTDGSGGILADRAGRDPRVRVLRQENRGLIATLNRGCAEAAGRYVARMDADDVSFPDRLERQVAFLETHPGVAAVGGAVQYMDDRGPLKMIQRHPADPEAIREGLLRASCLAHPTVVMRRDAVVAAGGYRPAFLHAEDYDLWLRLAEREDLANLPAPVLYQRLHPEQVSFAHIEQQVIATLGAQAAARARRAGRSDPAEGAAAITRRFLLDAGLQAEAIDLAIVAGFVFRGDLMLRLGQTGAAERILPGLLGLSIAPAARRRARAEALWLRGKIAARRGRRLRSAAALLAACWRRPVFVRHLAASLWTRFLASDP